MTKKRVSPPGHNFRMGFFHIMLRTCKFRKEMQFVDYLCQVLYTFLVHRHVSEKKSSKTFEKQKVAVLIGNSNVGKSLLFKHLTGQYVTVSNYPGTTVEISKGIITIGDEKFDLIDTPGIRTLLATSDDERVTRDILLNENPDLVILVADVKNLKRALILLYQITLFQIKTVLVLNMWDEARNRGITVDIRKLQELTGIPVVPTIAIQGWGIKNLHSALSKASVPKLKANFGELIDRAIEDIKDLIQADSYDFALAFLFIGGDHRAEAYLNNVLSIHEYQKAMQRRQNLQKRLTEPIPIYMFTQMTVAADILLNKVLKKTLRKPINPVYLTLDYLMSHPVFGYGFLAVVLFLMYIFVGLIGAQTLVDLLENGLFNAIINPFLIKFFNFLPLPSIVIDFFVGKFGVFTMALTYGLAIIFPIVLTFFIAFGILEDSGYLPRLALLLDRIFKVMGLTGKAVLPMVLGLGCDTMATVTTRTLETKKEKVIVTLLLALGVPCSAQLGVVMAMMAGVSANAFLIWVFVVTLNLMLIGFLASKVIPGPRNYFILEVPPLRVPSISNIIWKTMARLEWYLKEVIPLFILGTAILFFMDITGVLKVLEALFKPVVVSVLGLPADAAVGFIMGFLRRDYGAAGFFMLQKQGLLNSQQVIVSIVTITLFVPCIANALVMIKERGWKIAVAIMGFIIPYAVFVGWATKVFLSIWHI